MALADRILPAFRDWLTARLVWRIGRISCLFRTATNRNYVIWGRERAVGVFPNQMKHLFASSSVRTAQD